MNKKNIIIGLIGIILLVITTIVVSYAYFSVGNKTGEENVITSGTMALRFVDGNQITVNNLIPGEYAEKEFSVENTGNVATTYDVYLSEVLNNFADKTDLVYEITSLDGGYSTESQIQAPSSVLKIVNQQTIGVGVTHHYKLKITFLAKNENQDDNQGKNFSAKIQINNYKEIDATVNYYLDNELVNEIPTDKTFIVGICDKGATITFDEEYLTYELTNINEQNTICGLYFESGTSIDESGAAEPELYEGLIPVIYNGTNNPIVANAEKNWYNYDNHKWANAVLVSNPEEYFENGELKASKIGQQITSGILQYYVWIPRYKYLLWNTNNEASDEQIIEIEFQDKEDTKATGSTNGTWLTHPAFTFGTTELNGIWVGKFEATGSLPSASNPTALTILPNSLSVVGEDKTISIDFYAVRNMDINYASNYGLNTNEIDTHMMKNMEWGAVAYLTHSKYGRYNADATCVSGDCEVTCSMVYKNPITGYGCSANDCTWNAEKSYKASTTYNQYGVYDMAGTNIEWVMGNQATNGGQFASSNAGFTTAPNSRYYDSYRYTSCCDSNYPKYMLGDATRETLKINTGDYMGSKTWYDGRASSIMGNYSWVIRGGDDNCGLYKFGYTMGDKFIGAGVIAFRIVLTAQDGDANSY